MVNCAGQWAKALGDLAGVTVPLHSAEHFYVVTEAVEGTHPDLPIMRDPDGWTYFKEEVGGLVVGGFEPEAKPWRSPDDLPYPFEFQLLDEDWEHFSVLMDEAVRRIPALGRDRDPEVLQRPGVVHARQPVPAGRGAGAARLLRRRRLQLGRHRVGRRRRARARRVGRRGRADQRPGRRSTSAGSRRSTATTAGCATRVAEVLGLHYAVPWPNREPESRRATSGSRRCTNGWPRQGRCSAPGWAGSGRNVFAPAGPACDVLVGQARRGCRGRPPSSAPRATASRSSTRRRSPSTSSPAPDALGGAAVGLRRRRRRAGRALRLHAVAQRARHLRGRPHRHPRRARRRSCWSRSSATTVRDLDWLRRHLAGRDVARRGRHRRVRGARGDGSAVTRAAGAARRDADWSEEGVPVRAPAARCASPGSTCAPPG